MGEALPPTVGVMTVRAARTAARARRTLVSAAVLAATTLGLAGPASAAGPVLVTSGNLDISAERAVISWVDGQQHMLLQYDLQGRTGTTEPAVVLIATPTPPEISLADPATLTAFVDVSTPEIIEEEHWWPDLQSFGGGSETRAWQRPEETLAPTGNEVASHNPAASADDIVAFYGGQGYEFDDLTVEALQTYTSAGWTISEITVDPGEESLDARSTPAVDLRFASETAVVPVLLTAGGSLPMNVSTYVLGTERLDRTSMPSSAVVRYSGPVSAADDALLTDWLAPFGGTAVMTVVDQSISQPSQITDDITFGPSIFGPVEAGTEVLRVERIILGVPAGLVLVAGGMLAVAVVGVTISRLMQRGYRD